MRSFLDEKERAALVREHKKERDKRVCDRIKAILLCDEGWTYMEISRVLLLSDDAIRQHVKEYKNNRKLKPGNGGSSELLNKQQSSLLEEHLQKHTYMFTKDIVRYVEAVFSASYSIPGMHKWLARHGFSYKKPTIVPGKANLSAQQEWIAKYEKLKRNLTENETICFMDGVHPTHNSQAHYGWIKRGVRKNLPTNTGRQRLNICGAVDLLKTKFVFRKEHRLNAASTVDFLKQVEDAYPQLDRVHIFCDNAGYYKGDLVKEYLRKSKIELHFLPPYSPNLNPIERVWKFLKDRVIYNTYYESFSDFQHAVLGFLETLGGLNPASELGKAFASRIRDKFRPIGSPITDSSS